jgi:hypothetical protein
MRTETNPAAHAWRALGDLKGPNERLVASIPAAVITPIVRTAERGRFEIDGEQGRGSGVPRSGWLLLGEEALYGSFEELRVHDAGALRFPLAVTLEREWAPDARTLRLRSREPGRAEQQVSFYLPGSRDEHVRFDEAIDDALMLIKERRGMRFLQT